ncbi:MAG: hypothetical protein OEV92_00410 [Nitrospinota bacterium]|nr:hypothetical protein [Nitrospinota bacterium]
MKKFLFFLIAAIFPACEFIPQTPCEELGHTSNAAFRKELGAPSNQFRVEIDELGGRAVESGRISAVVYGFGDLAAPVRDSFFLLIETVRPGGYRVVFSGDTWRDRDNMMTRWTVQHFPPGRSRMEPSSEFEHWLYPDRKYIYDCSWDSSRAICHVQELGTDWSAEREVRVLEPLGSLVKPLVFGDRAAEAYQSMGPGAVVEKACISIY